MVSQRDCEATDASVLKLTPEAMAAIATIEAETELALREDGPLASLRDWGGKYDGGCRADSWTAASGRARRREGPEDCRSDDTTVWAAADIGTYYKFCAIQAFEVMATDPTIADAVYLLGKLKAHPDRHHLRTRHAARRPQVPEESRPTGGRRDPGRLRLDTAQAVSQQTGQG